MAKAKERELGFEESLSALEKIVAQLESGDLPLEKALELFENGVGLARRCQSQLEEAEHKVELLLRERGEIKLVPFEIARENQTGDPEKPGSLTTSAPTGIEAASEDRNTEEEGADLDDQVPF
jgi:exodeoxyribonuclease VII small subunit